MDDGEHRLQQAGRFVLDVSAHRVLDADHAFYNLTDYRAGARFEEIFEKGERAAVQQCLAAQEKPGTVGSFTAKLRTGGENGKTACVFFECREMLSGTLRLHGTVTALNLPVTAAQIPAADQYTMQELKDGIDNNEFSLSVQPFYQLNTGKIAGGEILTRWIKNGEELLPNEFFSRLETASVGCELDYHVFTSALPSISGAFRKNGVNLPISFNLSEAHFRHGGFAERVEALAETFSVDKSSIMFEIKAEVLESRDAEVYQQLADLRAEGFRVVVDGIKGDSRSMLVVESGVVDFVKMERAFIARCADTDFGRDLLQLLLAAVKKANIRLICAGVETKQQMDFLKKCGCEYAQGYFLARPMPLDEFCGTL